MPLIVAGSQGNGHDHDYLATADDSEGIVCQTTTSCALLQGVVPLFWPVDHHSGRKRAIVASPGGTRRDHVGIRGKSILQCGVSAAIIRTVRVVSEIRGRTHIRPLKAVMLAAATRNSRKTVGMEAGVCGR